MTGLPGMSTAPGRPESASREFRVPGTIASGIGSISSVRQLAARLGLDHVLLVTDPRLRGQDRPANLVRRRRAAPGRRGDRPAGPGACGRHQCRPLPVRRAIGAGATDWKAVTIGTQIPRDRVFAAIRGLRGDGLIGSGTPYLVTPDGWEAIE